MLRTLLGAAPCSWDGLLGDTAASMKAFMRMADKQASSPGERASRYRTYAVWTEGLLRSLEELEESLFAARLFAERIAHVKWAELAEQEKLDYSRHVYFDKNAYIRVFSLLDKLGTLMNDLLELRTEKIKAKYSYFTVLRRLRETGRHPELAARLIALKEDHRAAMNRLRARRNMEIHYMNAELKDDLQAGRRLAGEPDGGYMRLEDLSANLADAQEGWEMAVGTLQTVYEFAGRQLRRTS